LTDGGTPRDPTDTEAFTGSKPARFFRAAQVASLGLEMGIAVAIGAGLGWLLDSWLGTKPWLLLVFLLFGVAAGFKGMLAAAERANPGGPASKRQKDDHGSERARPN
jgi:ATP synthase protein I